MTTGIRMTSHWKQRFALLVCLLLVREEFARARHFRDLHNNKYDQKKQDIDDYTSDDVVKCKARADEIGKRGNIDDLNHLRPQATVEESGLKKGWINANLIFKGFKFFATGAGFLTTTADLVESVYRAIEGCCGPANREACSYHAKFTQAREEVQNCSKQADQLQLDAEVAQMWIEDTSALFAKILDEFDRIDAEQDKLIQGVSADVTNATITAKERIKELIQEKNDTVDGIPFVEVDSLYRSALENALNIGLSTVNLAIPTAYTIFQYSRYKSRMRRLGYIELEEDVEFKLPKKRGTSLFQKTKFGRWMARQASRIKTKVIDLKRRFNISFKKAKKFSLNFVDVLGAAFNLATAGYSIYKMIRNEGECEKKRQDIRCAYITTKEAQKKITGQINDINIHKGVMTEAWCFMRSNLTDKLFLKSVRETGDMMAGASNQSVAMQSVAVDIMEFANSVDKSNDYNMTYDASLKLYKALGKVPFSLECYRSKLNAINKINADCKRGDRSIYLLLEETRKLPENVDKNNPNDPRNCKDRLGFMYVKDDLIIKAWKNIAAKEGYHASCYMNDILNREQICKKMKIDLMNAQQIAEDLHLEKKGVQDVMNALLRDFSPSQKRKICNFKRKLKDNKTKLELYFKKLFVKKGYILDDVYTVKCPAPVYNENERCVSDDIVPPKVPNN